MGIGSGVEMSLHASLPVEIEGKMTKGEIELSIREPSEVLRSGLVPKFHGFVMPYTFKYNLLTVTPISHSTQLKKIVSGINRKPISIEVGQSLGLAGRVRYQSDAKFIGMFSYIQKIIQHTPLSIVPTAILPSSVRSSSLALEMFPSKAEIKEFNIVIRLSTKGMIHSFSKKQISNEEISPEFSQVKSVLSQLEKAHVVEIIGMTKSSSGSELKKIQTVVVLGKKSTGVSPSLESHLAAVEVLPIGARETFTLRYDGKIEMPKLMNRWNVVKMVEESLKGGFQGELFFGKPSQMESIKVVAKLEKTEELKREIRESPEFKQCMIEQLGQELLTPICTIVRHQAASLDKIRLTIHTPKTWAKSTFLNLLEGVSKALLLGNIESERIISGTEGVVIAEACADRISQVVTLAKVITPTREFVMKNLRLMGLTRLVLPATGIRTPIEVAALKLTGDRIPSTCRVEPSYVRTFDNMTVEYPINDCEHVLLLDGSKHIPVAITTRTVESQKKIVKILAGITEVQIIPVAGSMKVLVNGQPITLPAIGEQLIKDPSGQDSAHCPALRGQCCLCPHSRAGLEGFTNGSMVEVVAPQLLKSRTVGLCGDMNGERSADLKTPGMCVLRPRLAALSFM